MFFISLDCTILHHHFYCLIWFTIVFCSSFSIFIKVYPLLFFFLYLYFLFPTFLPLRIYEFLPLRRVNLHLFVIFCYHSLSLPLPIIHVFSLYQFILVSVFFLPSAIFPPCVSKFSIPVHFCPHIFFFLRHNLPSLNSLVVQVKPSAWKLPKEISVVCPVERGRIEMMWMLFISATAVVFDDDVVVTAFCFRYRFSFRMVILFVIAF